MPATWRITSAEAERAARRVAGALTARGLVPGDRVAVSLPSSPGALALFLGAVRAGVVPVPLPPTLTHGEQAAIVADCAPALVVGDKATLATLLDGREVEIAPYPRARPMHYTSGTTGKPKGVWSGVLDDADASAALADEREAWGFGSDDIALVCSPLHHSAPLRFATGALLAGGDVVLLERLDATSAWAAVGDHRPSVAFLVPTHLRRLFAPGQGAPDLRRFRLVAPAGEPCPPDLKRRTMAAFPTGTVWEFYGSTEGQFTQCSPEEWLQRPGTVGRARRHRELQIGGDGRIWCTPPSWARFEYWGDPAKTARAWRDGAFTVDDVGELDDDGYLFLRGRRDDLIISGGVNVYPAEVEAALSSVAGADELVAFGVPDDHWGERVCVAVVGDVEPDRLHRAARERLAPHKRPKDVYPVVDLPRTSTGKVRRTAVAAFLGLAEARS